ncbi:hypothetical protein Ccrd_007897 [Cynara cardunculus var. scolymus]|uniref:Uncharacterized protein n=1 Tax=Cynara cardunculus var. scolymus TaxID=59895 RepID=A0A103XG57_CYNCS|nr:hypothetical protein Ccrd_007897 [Cynara cardunculus var. scolymus]
MDSKEASSSETLGSGLDHNHQISQQHYEEDHHGISDPSIRETEDSLLSSTSSSITQKKILRVVEVVERDSIAIADSFSSLFASLRVTSRSVDHVQCFSDAAGRLQESVF